MGSFSSVVDWSKVAAQLVKNLPALQETLLRFLGQEDSLEKGQATHSSILAWRIPWTEALGGLKSMGSQRARQTQLSTHTHTHTEQTFYQHFMVYLNSILIV